MELNNYSTVKDYAIKKGVTVQSVYQKIRRKTLEFKKVGVFIFVKKD